MSIQDPITDFIPLKDAVPDSDPSPLGGEGGPEGRMRGQLVPKTIVLAGNPNVGKSLFFNAFTGKYVNVSNFPGTTVDVPKGEMNLSDEQTAVLKDTPGIYGMSGMSEEETVAEQTILNADIVINVVSALSLERDLFLTQQLIDYGQPLIISINQMDEASARHLEINLVALEKLLGVPVFPTVAITKQGLEEVKKAVLTAKIGHVTPDFPPAKELRVLESNIGERIRLYGHRRQHVNALVSQVVRDQSQQHSKYTALGYRFGQLLLNPLAGLTAMALVLLALYQVIGVWVAGDIVDFLEGKIMLGQDPQFFVGIVPALQALITPFLKPETFWYTVLAGEFGVLTMSIQYIFGVLFPLVLGFYVYISLLEDCGYLPRVAVLADGLLNKIGLNGRAVIPIILGFGCVTMATVSTRVLTSQRERTIASAILAITIPCSAQLAVIMALMASAGGLKAWAVYLGVLFTILVTLGTCLNKILPGRSSQLVMDLPPMRLPRVSNILTKSWIRTKVFLIEAAPLFLLGSLIVAIFQATGLLTMAEKALAPVTQAVLHLPGETAKVFIMGLVRRDFGAAGLLFMQDILTPLQILTSLVVITLFVPCLASAAVICKERGALESTTIIVSSWLLAFGVGAVVTRLFTLFPIL